MTIDEILDQKLDKLRYELMEIKKLVQPYSRWITKQEFLRRYPDVTDREFRSWRDSGEIRTKKRGRKIFIDMEEFNG